MEELIKKFELLFEDLKQYTKAKYDLATLKLFIKVTNIAGNILSTVSLLIFGSLAFFFLSFALAFWLGEVFNSTPLGFLCVAGFFILIFLLLIIFRKKIVFPIIRNRLIKKYYESDQNL